MVQIDDLSKKVDQLSGVIAGLQEMLELPIERVALKAESSAEQDLPYKNMSMRWGVLNLLSEHTDHPLPTAEIAARLVAGGYPQSTNFNSKVSAILSQMLSKLEVAKDGQDWCIRQHGKEVWESIKRGEKYLNRHSGLTEVDPLGTI